MNASLKPLNKTLSTVDQDIIAFHERRINTIYLRGGLSALKGRQLFVNEATKHCQVRLQHIAMLFRDEVESTKGVVLYFIRTPKKTDFKKFDTNKKALKKFFYVKTDKSESMFSIRDYFINSQSNVDFENLKDEVNLSLPSFNELHAKINEMVIEKKLSSVQADFCLDYFCYLSKCMGKQPRFTLSLEQAEKIRTFAVNPQWIQDTLDIGWLAVDPTYKQSKVEVAKQRLDKLTA